MRAKSNRIREGNRVEGFKEDEKVFRFLLVGWWLVGWLLLFFVVVVLFLLLLLFVYLFLLLLLFSVSNKKSVDQLSV